MDRKRRTVFEKADSLLEIPIGTNFSLELEDVEDVEALQIQIYQDGDLKNIMELKTDGIHSLKAPF